MPDPGASANTWGATLNATTQKVDAQVFVNAGRGVEIGSGALWFTATPPANWLICDGSSLSTAAPYDKLFAVIGYKFGGSGANFNLPPLANFFPFGASATHALASTGGEATHILTAAELAAHTHTATQAAHSHTATQAAHSHSASQDAHTHNVSQDAHSHTLQSALGSGSGLTNGGASFSLGTITTSTAQPAVHIDTQQPAVHIDTQQPAITVANATPAITVANNTGGGAHNNMPPFLSVNFIIKFQ
jgi:microcystin-dependent protein